MITSTTLPRFIASHERALRAWCAELADTDGTVVAISRKGPRLLQLLEQFGLLRPDVLPRTITERALPFLESHQGDIVVVDDLVSWGSTFARVAHVAKSTLARAGVPSARVIGMPFAVCDKMDDAFREHIDRSFCTLRADECSAFVSLEAAAMRLAGIPLDIEHPILTIEDPELEWVRIQAVVEEVASRLNADAYSDPRESPTTDWSEICRNWTVVFRGNHLAGGQQFRKLRFFLSADQKRLSVAAMSPIPIGESQFEHATQLLDGSLTFVSNEVSAHDCVLDDALSDGARGRSRATWANYLIALPFLADARDCLKDVMSEFGWTPRVSGPKSADLQFLIGMDAAKRALPLIEDYLDSPATARGEVRRRIAEWPCPVHLDERIPEAFRCDYIAEMAKEAEFVEDEAEATEALFHIQHRVIEYPSRVSGDGARQRLEFGVTFNGLLSAIKNMMPAASTLKVHRALDSLVDQGAVVPRYVNLSCSDEPVWVRTFRVGEGPLRKVAHTFRHLFESLALELKQQSVPHMLLEKHLVVALSLGLELRRLAPLRELKVLQRRFYLYGARMALRIGGEDKYVVDWAQKRKFLRNDDKGQYALNDERMGALPKSEFPWDTEVTDGLDDLATFVRIVHETEGLKGNALVAITTLATEDDYFRAVEAELALWMYDEDWSVNHVLSELSFAVDAFNQNVQRASLQRADQLLKRAANFTAQIAEKRRIFEARSTFYSKIDAATKGDKVASRVWREISSSLRSREGAESGARGLKTLLSISRVAFRATTVLRNVLSSLGVKDRRSTSMRDSLGRLLELMEDQGNVDSVAMSYLKGGGPRPNLFVLVRDAIESADDAGAVEFTFVRRIVEGIIDSCSEVLESYGTKEVREAPESLTPPKFLLMWDVRGSTTVEDAHLLQEKIGRANRSIYAAAGARCRDFRPESLDDGNGLICESFEDVIIVYEILLDELHPFEFRAGVEVNLQGLLDWYPTSRRIGGRAYAHAARVTAMFKEVQNDRASWMGEVVPVEPGGSYLVVGEFAKRFAEAGGARLGRGFEWLEFDGLFAARVLNALPIKVSVVVRNGS